MGFGIGDIVNRAASVVSKAVDQLSKVGKEVGEPLRPTESRNDPVQRNPDVQAHNGQSTFEPAIFRPNENSVHTIPIGTRNETNGTNDSETLSV